jgi:hypothetical protein
MARRGWNDRRSPPAPHVLLGLFPSDLHQHGAGRPDPARALRHHPGIRDPGRIRCGHPEVPALRSRRRDQEDGDRLGDHPAARRSRSGSRVYLWAACALGRHPPDVDHRDRGRDRHPRRSDPATISSDRPPDRVREEGHAVRGACAILGTGRRGLRHRGRAREDGRPPRRSHRGRARSRLGPGGRRVPPGRGVAVGGRRATRDRRPP